MSNRCSPHGAPLNAPYCVSSGTLRTPDLLRCFADELERLKPFSSSRLLYEARAVSLGFDDLNSDMPDEEAATEVLADLTAELEAIAKAHGMIFGPQEGDGACFGFWLPETEEAE